MSKARKKSEKGRAAGKPIVLPSAYAPRGTEADHALLHPDHATQIQQLVDLLKRNHLTELEVERGGIRVRVRHEPFVRSAPAHAAEPAHPTAAPLPHTTAPQAQAPADTAGQVTITSPIVGTFYRSPSPDADPYVDRIEFGPPDLTSLTRRPV